MNCEVSLVPSLPLAQGRFSLYEGLSEKDRDEVWEKSLATATPAESPSTASSAAPSAAPSRAGTPHTLPLATGAPVPLHSTFKMLSAETTSVGSIDTPANASDSLSPRQAAVRDIVAARKAGESEPGQSLGSKNDGIISEVERATLVALYEKHNPAKVADVDGLIGKYNGNEALLWQQLRYKYGVEALQEAEITGAKQVAAGKKSHGSKDQRKKKTVADKNAKEVEKARVAAEKAAAAQAFKDKAAAEKAAKKAEKSRLLSEMAAKKQAATAAATAAKGLPALLAKLAASAGAASATAVKLGDSPVAAAENAAQRAKARATLGAEAMAKMELDHVAAITEAAAAGRAIPSRPLPPAVPPTESHGGASFSEANVAPSANGWGWKPPSVPDPRAAAKAAVLAKAWAPMEADAAALGVAMATGGAAATVVVASAAEDAARAAALKAGEEAASAVDLDDL